MEPVAPSWALHQEPHRHYKVLREADGKWVWQNRDKTRIASVTTILDGDMDRLLGWAVGKAFTAFERVALDRGAIDGLDDLGELCQATGLMPDTYRDLKGDIGTAGHTWLELRLTGSSAGEHDFTMLPYGYRLAIDAFIDETGFRAEVDERGPRIERAVGDEARAVAGTYDAQGRPTRACALLPGLHRIDLKSSNSTHPKMFAQLAEYERDAVLCGEDRSDYLTIIHIDALGNWTPSTIPTGGEAEADARAYFDAALALYRLGPKLRKHLAP
jgi:hypothetical protein